MPTNPDIYSMWLEFTAPELLSYLTEIPDRRYAPMAINTFCYDDSTGQIVLDAHLMYTFAAFEANTKIGFAPMSRKADGFGNTRFDRFPETFIASFRFFAACEEWHKAHPEPTERMFSRYTPELQARCLADQAKPGISTQQMYDKTVAEYKAYQRSKKEAANGC